MRHINGAHVSIGMLPKANARQLYQIAQQREEEAIEIRRQRQMEETAAGATNISVNSPATAPAQAVVADPMSRMKQLKEMLDAGLIEQADFEKRKEAILGEV